MTFLQQLINGIHVGSIYALIALGYTMVYGIIKLINFAHGDIIMMGAYITFVSLIMLNVPAWMAIIIAILVCLISGILIERIAYKPPEILPGYLLLLQQSGLVYS